MKLNRFPYISMILSITMLGGGLLAQNTVRPAFEVASIKPARSFSDLLKDNRSGGVSIKGPQITNTRADFGYMPLDLMIRYAYKLRSYQIIGPDWLASQAFEIHAKIPEGGTKEQVREMMQSLLEERFKMVCHREQKVLPVYALVLSKDGHKLKETAADPLEDAAKSRGEQTLKGGASTNPDGTEALTYSNVTMTQFGELLNQHVNRPVIDMTGLKGYYDISLTVSRQEYLNSMRKTAMKIGLPPLPDSNPPGENGLLASEPAGISIFQEIQKLGLRLDSRDMTIDTLVIDHIEKNPTEN